MAKKETKKDRKRRRKLFLALIMILLLLATLGTATYAWFTANRTVTVEAVTVNVSTSQGLQISTNASDWKAVVTNSDILGANWVGVVNQIPNGEGNTMVPVSTAGLTDTATGFMQMWKGTVETDASTGNNILTAVASVEDGGTNKNKGDFVVFDLFFQTSEAHTVYLTSGSNVVYSGTDKGIQNAARVAFIDEGHVAYGSTPASAQALHAGTLLKVWEPNYDVHTASGVSNAANVYGHNVSQTGASQLSYYGVKAAIAAGNAIPLNSTNSTYFAQIASSKLFGTPASGIPTTQYQEVFDLLEGVTKIRIYMWIEGQDVDCEDHASGSALTYNLQFSIDENAG